MNSITGKSHIPHGSDYGGTVSTNQGRESNEYEKEGYKFCNPMETMRKNMKFIMPITALLTVAMLYGCSPSIDGFDTDLRDDGLLYHSNTSRLVTGAIVFRHKGRKLAMQNYVDGKKHGIGISWHDNGKRMARESYTSGKAHGEFLEWNSKGKLISKKHFETGKLHGEYLKWTREGKLISERHYENGVAVRR